MNKYFVLLFLPFLFSCSSPVHVNTAAENLEAAKAALNRNYEKDNVEKLGDYEEAKKYLQQISLDTPIEHYQAELLLEEVANRERIDTAFKERKEKEYELEQQSFKNHTSEFQCNKRKEAAETLERFYLSNNLDTHISVRGKFNTIITIECVLFNRPLIYKLVNEGDYLQTLKKVGYEKAIFTDGYEQIWTYDLMN